MSPPERSTPTANGTRPSTQDVDGVLLCAGVGKRMRPLTESLPKALVPVAGRPIVDYHLEAWRAAGVRRAVLVTGYLHEKVEEHVGDGRRFDLSVEYAFQPERRGTGDALLAAAGAIRAPWLLVGYADVFFGDAPSLWASLLADRTTKIVGVSVPDAGRYGRLVTDGNAPWPRLRAIREKDGIPTPGLANAGAYLLPRRVVELLAQVPLSPRGEVELTDAVTMLVVEGQEVRVVPTSQWIDVGTPEHLALASRMARTPFSRDRSPEPRPTPEA